MPLPSKARVYADVNTRKPKSYSDYLSYTVSWKSSENYELVKRLGRGKYSEVFEAVEVSSKEPCVVKILKPVSPRKIRREVKILENLRDGPNIITFKEAVRTVGDNGISGLIFEHVNDTGFGKVHGTLSDGGTRFYLYELLKALDYCHSMGIMHRDLKPSNVVFDRENKKLRLIDWGLAEFYYPGKEYDTRVASLHYKPPELLLGYRMYDYSMDMWSFGCIVASMVLRNGNGPIFRGIDNADQLIEIVKVLGKKDFLKYLEKYKIEVNPCIDFQGIHPRQPWDGLFSSHDYKPLINPEALDLLDKLLRYDHSERLSAREAMGHKYFDTVARKQKVVDKNEAQTVLVEVAPEVITID